MRVLVLLENHPAFVDHRVWPECLALRDLGCEVVVLSPAPRPGVAHPVEEGIELHFFPLERPGGGIGAYLREYFLAFWHIARLTRQLARTRQFDVVHAANPPDILLLAALPLKRRGTRFVFDHHDLVPELFATRFGGDRGFLYRTLLILERATFAAADVVIATNDSYARVATTRGRKRPDDVFVVRNGPDLARFTSTSPDPPRRRDDLHLITYVGVMGPQDGVDHALRALAVLRARRRDWRAVFAGHGEALPSVRELATELGLADVVEFPGFLDDDAVVGLLGRSDVCLAPEPKNRFNEASTMMKIAEYMAMSRPTVSYDLVESRVTAGDAALYARPDDVESFARCIEELLDDPARRARMGAIGRGRVESALSWSHSKPALLAAYLRVVDRGARLRRR
jgi:glycosyltransferase involved in cell wall biosynthesis